MLKKQKLLAELLFFLYVDVKAGSLCNYFFEVTYPLNEMGWRLLLFTTIFKDGHYKLPRVCNIFRCNTNNPAALFVIAYCILKIGGGKL